MKRLKQSLRFALLCAVITAAAINIQASVKLDVYSKDEGLSETKTVKPRIYIRNTGTETVNGFYFYYYIKVENGKTPVVETWWSPGATITNEKLSDGRLRVIYACPGVQLKAGDCYPSVDGNVIGIHYVDWLYFDKSNDYSNPSSGNFTFTNKVPVYSMAGVLLSGVESTPVVPSIPPVEETPPPQQGSPNALFEYAIYSTEGTFFNDRCSYSGDGFIGSKQYIETGLEAIAKGSFCSGGTVLIKDRTRIEGSVRAGGSITLLSGAVITGDKKPYSVVPQLTIPLKGTISVGTENIDVANNQSRTILPGTYADFHAFSNSKVTFIEGVYNFKTFYLEPDVDVIINAQTGSDLEINVVGEIRFADRTEFYKNSTFPANINFYTNYAGVIRLGCDCRLVGILSAPKGEIWLNSRTCFTGGIYGKKVATEPGAIIAGDPINPILDYDNDGVLNYIEKNFETNPNDSESYPLFASTDKSLLSGSGTTIINYDYSNFADYSDSKKLPIVIPPSIIMEGLAPIIHVSNKPAVGTPPFESTIYSKVGRYVIPEGTVKSGGSISMGIPLPDNTNLNPDDISIGIWNDSFKKWDIITPDSVTGNGVYYTVKGGVSGKSLTPSMIVTKDRTTTAYIDNVAVLSEKSNVQVSVDISISGLPQYLVDLISNTDGLTISYLQSGINVTKTVGISCLDGKCILTKAFAIAAPIIMQNVTINLPGTLYDHNITSTLELKSGDYLSIEMSTTFKDYTNTKIVGDKILLRHFPSSIMIEYNLTAEGAITPVYGTNDSVNSFTYSYYLKDHLGSTRVVIDDQGNVTEATLYDTYGKMTNLHGGTDTKEKFTGKEFDQEGDFGGVGGIDAYHFGARMYDPEIGKWLSTDPGNQHYDSYLYASSNPMMRVDPDGRLDVITHYLIGGRHEAGGDFWRSRNPLVKKGLLNHHGKEKLAKDIHNPQYRSVEGIKEFFETHDRSEYDMTEAEWNGFKQHAINDALHEYPSPDQRPYSPVEAILYFSGKDGTGASESLAKYQDASGGLAFVGSPMAAGIGSGILPFMPITGTLLITVAALQEADYAGSLMFHYFENAASEIEEEGFLEATGEAVWSDVKQTSAEVAIAPLIAPIAIFTPITTTVLAVRSFFNHVRHLFLQD